MKLLSISLSGYRQFHSRSELEIPSGLVGICGPNGVGKSKLIEALGFCLYGPNARVLPTGDRAADLPSAANEEVPLRVEVALESAGQTIEVIRTRGAGILVRLTGEPAPLAEGPRDVTAKVTELLGLTPDAFHSTCVARQKEIALLQTLSPTVRCKVVNRLIGITAFEEAIKAAEAECGRRQTAYEGLATRASDAVENAGQAVATCEDALNDALAAEAEQALVLGEAKSALDSASASTVALELEYARLGRRREEAETLEHDLRRAESESREARLDLARCIESVQIAGAASFVLDRTEDVAMELAVESYLQAREDGALVLCELELRAAGLREDVREAEILRRRLDDIDDTVERLRNECGVMRADLTVCENLARQAETRKQQHQKRRETTRRLGADGECETCGQKFGNNLQTALLHRDREIAVAEMERQEQLKQAADLRRKIARLDSRAADEQVARRRTEVSWRRVSSAETSERELARDIESRQRDLDLLPGRMGVADAAALESVSFDQENLLWLEWRGVCRDEAESLRLKHVGVLARQASAEMRAREAAGHAAELNSRALLLAEDVAKTKEIEVELASATRTKVAATQAYEDADRDFRRETASRVTAEAGLKAAKIRETEALALQRQAEEGRYGLRVAQRTKTVLKDILDAIIDEARPRIAQIMEGWCRNLMGDHFQSVRLTQDYLVQADNGSGLHQIHHFSGGEQTLLAVMLRVAISIYCQERAGVEAGFLVLDEVFGDQDAIHRDHLVQFLQDIQTHFHQILVVNHIEAVTDQFDSIIQVERMGPKSSRAFLQI